MQLNESDDKDNNPRQINNYVKYSGVAFQMIAIIGVFAYAGYWIDSATQNKVHWITALFSLTGVLISLYIVIRSLKE